MLRMGRRVVRPNPVLQLVHVVHRHAAVRTLTDSGHVPLAVFLEQDAHQESGAVQGLIRTHVEKRDILPRA